MWTYSRQGFRVYDKTVFSNMLHIDVDERPLAETPQRCVTMTAQRVHIKEVDSNVLHDDWGAMRIH
jgi:hypothetical protein